MDTSTLGRCFIKIRRPPIMYKPHFILLICCLLQASISAGQTISGFVEDKNSGERLIGANVFDLHSQLGTATNTFGFFSLSIKAPGDSITVIVSYIGYERWQQVLASDADVQLKIQLVPQALLADSVTIFAEKLESITETTAMSVARIPVKQLAKMPSLLGEVDVMKTLQLLPGVQSGNEGSSGMYVRGGGPDQNLILLDGVPVYNASHLFGFFSVFNSDAIKNIQLTKGGFPARFGGRLSSVIEVNMKDGNNQEVAAKASIGLVASRFMLEGPIQKGKSSFILSGRRTYLDLLVRPLMPDDEKAGYYFADVTAKFNHIFSARHRLYLSTYTGIDRFSFESKDDYSTNNGELDWGNITSTLRWNWLHSGNLFSNTTLMYSRYRFEVFSGAEELQGNEDESYFLRHYSGIEEFAARIDYDYIPSPLHYVKFGINVNSRSFNPGAIQLKTNSNNFNKDLLLTPNQQQNALEINGYAEDDWKLNSILKINLGIHSSFFRVGGTQYLSVQPRLAARALIGDWAIKASYAEMRQNIHLLTNVGVGLPTDLWLPATEKARPQMSRQVAAGISRTVLDGTVDLSIESYYKTMDNLIAYKEGASFLGINEDWQDKIEFGEGRSYGVELFMHKKTGRTNGWLGYTLSWSDRQFDELNFGRRFSYRYDRRHDLSLAFTHQLSRNIDLSGAWIYGTGNSITLPTATYKPPEANGRTGLEYYEDIFYYAQRNGIRMGAYHRLDLSLQYYRRRTGGERFWTFGLFNAYSRRNPFFYFRETDYEGNRTIKQVSLFPVIPAISYTRTF